MIDEKKIEEAAVKYSAEEWLSDDCFTACIDGFHEGINWLKESLWHDANEEPKRRNKDKEFVECLVKFKDGIIGLYNYDDWHHWWVSGSDNEQFLNMVSRWLYIEDLIKGEK